MVNKCKLIKDRRQKYLKVERCGTLPDPAAGVVVAAVAGAVVASELSGVGDGDTSKMGADTKDDQPLGVLDTLAVVLGVSQGGGVNGNALFDFLSCSVSDKQGFASPLEGHVLACNNHIENKL